MCKEVPRRALRPPGTALPRSKSHPERAEESEERRDAKTALPRNGGNRPISPHHPFSGKLMTDRLTFDSLKKLGGSLLGAPFLAWLSATDSAHQALNMLEAILNLQPIYLTLHAIPSK